METNAFALHAHHWSISVETFKKTRNLKKLMKITQTDVLETKDGNVTFIDSMEAYKFPIYSTMYHPEY